TKDRFIDLHRWQDRKSFAGISALKKVRPTLLHVDRFDQRAARTAPAGFDRRPDRAFGTSERRLDATIAAVAHEALQIARLRHALDKRPVADTLHAPAHHDVADDAHAISPVSAGRAPR